VRRVGDDRARRDYKHRLFRTGSNSNLSGVATGGSSMGNHHPPETRRRLTSCVAGTARHQ